MKKTYQWAFAAMVCSFGLAVASCNYVADNAVNNDSDPESQEQNEKTIWVLSDIHVMTPELLNGEYQADDATKDPKMLLYSTEILDKLVGDALNAKPDMMLITGDLTEKGDQKSHKLVASKLGKLVSEGIKVVVIPGNHDINNPDGSTTSSIRTLASTWLMPKMRLRYRMPVSHSTDWYCYVSTQPLAASAILR